MNRIILVLLLALALPACAPSMTYEEIEAEAILTGDTTKLDKYEARVDAAIVHFEHKAACQAADMSWFCPHGAGAKERRTQRDIKKLLRDYRTEKFSRCGCITNAQMRQIFKDMSRSY